MQLVVLVGFDETLKQFDAGSQFSPAPCVRRALGFVKDSHVRHTRDNVTFPADSRKRIVTEGVIPSLHVYYKNTHLKQYHKTGRHPPAL